MAAKLPTFVVWFTDCRQRPHVTVTEHIKTADEMDARIAVAQRHAVSESILRSYRWKDPLGNVIKGCESQAHGPENPLAPVVRV